MEWKNFRFDAFDFNSFFSPFLQISEESQRMEQVESLFLIAAKIMLDDF